MNLFDKVVIRIVGFLTLLLLSFALTKIWIVSAFLAFLLSVGIHYSLSLLLSRLNAKRKMRVEDFENTFAVMGISEQKQFIFKSIPIYYAPKEENDGVSFRLRNQKIFLLPNYKFSPTGLEDLAKAYRNAKKIEADIIYILGKKCPREIIVFSKKFDVPFEFIPTKKVMEKLYNQNKLPKNIFEKKKKKDKNKMAPFLEKIKAIDLKNIGEKLRSGFVGFLSETFVRRRAKFFIVSSLSLAFLALFVPYKTYYIVFAVLDFLCGIICFGRETI